MIAEQPRLTEPREDAQEAQTLNPTAEGVKMLAYHEVFGFNPWKLNRILAHIA